MSRHEPMPTLPSGTADAVLDALPHPVIMVAADGRIANANAAAESFFEASLPLLRRHLLGKREGQQSNERQAKVQRIAHGTRSRIGRRTSISTRPW